MTMQQPPNVLWICTDQQRYDTLGCYGNEFVETGSIDRLAARGVRFERCYGQSPVCMPSRASMLTGRYPRTTGCRGNGQPISDDETLVPKLLDRAGYDCGLAGKLHLSPCQLEALDEATNVERRVDDGYEVFHWSHHPTHDVPTNAYLRWLRGQPVDFEDDIYTDTSTGAVRIDRSHRFEDEPYVDSDYVQISLPAEYHQTTWCAERAVEFVEAHTADQPWHFAVNFFDPHHAFDPPKAYLDRYLDAFGLDELPLPNFEPTELDDKPEVQRNDRHGAYNKRGYYAHSEMDDDDHRLVRAAYWAMVDLVDDAVGRILEALDRTNQRENTLVVFTSDHGEMLGDHGLYLKGPYFYEPAIRVPLVISWPRTVPEGAVDESLVELVDVAPTILDATGVERPSEMQARSLWPRLRDDSVDSDHRESIYCEYYDATDNYEEDLAATMVRTDEYKLVRWHSPTGGELYDLTDDPDETDNRWNDSGYDEVTRDLLSLLTDRMGDTVDPLPERTASW